MARLLIALMLMAGTMVACKPKSAYDISAKKLKNIPDSIMVVDSMVNILTDIHLAEAWAAENKTESLNQDEQLEKYYAEVFKLHHITSKQYTMSYHYYSSEPVLMNYIYQRVTEHLSLMESKNLNEIKKQKK